MSKSLGTALVGGGTGFVGSHLCNALKALGYAVTIISRMPGPQRMTWNELKQKGLPNETTVVVNLAGQNVIDFRQRWNSGFKQNVFNSRINTTVALGEAIKKGATKPGIFVSMSGVGIYKPDPLNEYDEECTGYDYDFLSKLCHEWEQAARVIGDEHTRRVTIRSGLVLGKNGGMIKQLYLPFYLGLGGMIMPGNQFMPWIHIDDLVGIILFAIRNNKVEGVLNGVAPQCITNKEFTEAFAKAMNRPALFPVPQIALNILLSKERANMITQGQKVIPKRTIELGYEFKYATIKAACSQIVKQC